MISLRKKRVRIEVTREQFDRLRQEVFSNLGLSGEQRRRVARKLLPLPLDGSQIDLFYQGALLGTL